MKAILLLMISSLPAFAAVPHLPKNALPVPLVAQGTNYSCGPAALMSLLIYWNTPFEGTESELYSMLETTPKDGTEPAKLAEAAQSFGLDATVQKGMTFDDLRHALKEHETVIVDIQAWRDRQNQDKPWIDDWDDGHYAVLIAMDGEYSYFMDSATLGAYAYIPLSELMDRWHDFEDRHGTIERNYQLGVIIRGKTPMTVFPKALVQMN